MYVVVVVVAVVVSGHCGGSGCESCGYGGEVVVVMVDW